MRRSNSSAVRRCPAFTVRRYSHAARALDIDFVLQEGNGIACKFALHAGEGDQFGFWIRPDKIFYLRVPPDSAFVFAGDDTALPGI